MAGHIKRLSRMLLECQNNDKLCVVRERQVELIFVPVLLVAVFIIVLGIILWLHYQSLRRKQQISSESKIEATLPISEKEKSQEEASISEHTSIQLNEMTMDCLLRTAALTLRDLEIPREKLESLEFIQNGRFGGIYRAELKISSPGKTQSVILKALDDSASSHDLKDFLERIQFYQFLGPHENIVKLLGCCINQTPCYMILEDAPNGNLLNFLWTCRKDVVTMDELPFDLTEGQVYRIGQQIASALDFLQQKKLFHGDVAARNILIGHQFTAKLCRLGLACRSHTCSPSSKTQTIPLKWQAPERLLKKPPNIKSDIWSFGILLYEMITLGAPPFPEVPPSDILQHLQREHIMKRPSSCQPTMYSIMKACWHWTPTDRPSLPELICWLQAALQTSNDQAVLQVPELVVPELYAAVAGIDVGDLPVDYTIF